MSLKQYFLSRYGTSTSGMVGQYSRCLEKLAKFKNHVAFSARCKREGVLPSSLRVKSPVDTVRGREIAERASRQFLSERLRIANYKHKQLEDEAKWRKLGLRHAIDETDFEKVDKISQDHAEKTFLQTREKQREKFVRMSGNQGHAGRQSASGKREDCSATSEKTSWVLNFSKHELTEAEKSTLERGLNFSHCPSKIPRENIIAGVESALIKCKDKQKAERVRATVASVLNTTTRPQKSNTSKEEREALRTLQTNDQIIILPADKGNATVILDKDEYERKARDLLSHPPFRKVDKDPTKRNEYRVNDTLKRLLTRRAIDRVTYDRLRVSVNGSCTPLFYGSVKIHKPERPLRPIVSAIGSATYDMSKYVSNILSEYVQRCNSYLRNTQDFVRKLEEVKIKEDEILVSFDVKSLFTSVPVPDAISAIKELVEKDEDFESRTGITTKTLIEMIHTCLSSTSFQFRSEHFELTDGLAMGSPLSPAVANLFMAALEEKAIATFPNPPAIWHRFVDDIFSIIQRNKVDALVDHLNAQNPSIKFTVEREAEGKLPFLDVKVHRCEGGSLKTSIYRKSTHTGAYLNYESNHPTSAKQSVVSSLMDRVSNITLGEDEKRREEKRVKRELEANGYPPNMIQRTKRKMKQRQAAKKKSQMPEQTTQITATIPYVRGISEAISRIVAPLGIRTVMKPTKRKWSLMKGAKDKRPSESRTGVVYALGCTECPKVYVGETARTAQQRIKEHIDHAKKGNAEMSAIAKHVLETGHAMHWKPRILKTERKTIERKVHEAFAIHTLTKRAEDFVMNQDKGM